MIVVHLSAQAEQLLERSQQHLLRLLHEKDYWEEQIWTADDDRQAARRSRTVRDRLLGRSSAAELAAYKRYEEARGRLDQVDFERRRLQVTVDQRIVGVRGEERLQSALKWLTDDWTMIRGYRNSRGEVDHLLVGPAGIWAVEVKSSNVRLQVDGDRWCQEKVDRRGRVLSREDACDRTGRPWGRQVGDVARALEQRLRTQGHALPVRTAVVLMHQRAKLGSIKQPGVDFVGTDHRVLLSQVAERTWPLDREQSSAVVDLVRQDHSFHEQRRQGRRHKTKQTSQ